MHIAQPAPLAADAADVDFGARLGVREEARTEPRRVGAGAEERLGHRGQRALEVGERDAAADDQAFDLVEHRRVRQVEVVAAIDRADRDQPHRRIVLLHVPDLHRARCACAAASAAAVACGASPRVGGVVRSRGISGSAR